MLSVTCQKLIEVRVRQLIWRRVQEALGGRGRWKKEEGKAALNVCVCVCIGGAAHLGIMLTLSMPRERGRQAGVAE